MLATTIGNLRNLNGKNVNFNVFSYYPERDRKLVNDENVDIYSATPVYLVTRLLPCALLLRGLKCVGLSSLARLLPKSVVALERSDVLICIAGVSFIDGRTKFIPFNIATLLPAMLLGVPVVKFAQAMGPFNSWLNRWAARLFLGRCMQVFARGEQTQSHLIELFGNKEVTQRADDVAFLFKASYSLSEPADGLSDALARLTAARRGGKPIVGLCPSVVLAKQKVGGGDEYIKRMQALVFELVNKGWMVALYPNATRGEDMDKTHNNDLPLLSAVLESLEPSVKENVLGFVQSYNADQIHEIIKACDIQIVSRFHAMVASLVSSVPVMVLGWSHKYHEVMACFEQADMVTDFKRWDLTNCLDRAEELMRERKERAETITKALPGVQRRSKRQFDYILNQALSHQ